MEKKKIVYISSIAAPHQIHLCEELQKYFIAESWFYDLIGKRASWWSIPLGKHCKIIPNVLFKRQAHFVTFSHIKMLKSFNPDIVMLGGFPIPANYIAYCWARFNKKKTIIFTERSRTKDGVLRKYNLRQRIIRLLYRSVDMVMVSSSDIVSQFRDEFKWGDKVMAGRYASIIDDYYNHPPRDISKRMNFIFPNRLTSIYNPLLAIEIFNEVRLKYHNAHLFLNAIGELRKECERRINELNLDKVVHFLDNIKKWDDLGRVYSDSDIMIFPALFSNGNFTITEAMASGIGIVLSNKILGNLHVNDGYNGFVINPNKEEFLDAINKFIDKPELINKFALINRELVKHRTAKSTAKLYYDLISKLFQ
jgi:glycosyltransferase involved in cell wall biosynthesis